MLSAAVSSRFVQRSIKPTFAAAMSTSSTTPRPTPIVEFREYQLAPQHVMNYVDATTKAADLRKSLVPLRMFSLPDTGGPLNVATHAYYYEGGHAQRDVARKAQGQNDDWKAYLKECRPYMQNQSSMIFVESPLVQKFEEIPGFASISESSSAAGDDNCILELRRYKLILGYDTVPKFMNLYEAGLPSKLSAEGTDPTTSLVTLLYSEVGRLNEVIEIWRHGNGTSAMEQSRVAARGATAWRSSIAEIAPLAMEFTSTIHKPTSFSPLR
jgi:hypothetical protein